jgi:hypothetical protein
VHTEASDCPSMVCSVGASGPIVACMARPSAEIRTSPAESMPDAASMVVRMVVAASRSAAAAEMAIEP